MLVERLHHHGGATPAAPALGITTDAPSPPKPPPLPRSRPLDERSYDGLTPLHFAAAHGALDSVRLLLSHGAAPDAPDAAGLLPSDHALRGVPGHVRPGEGHADVHMLLMRHLAR